MTLAGAPGYHLREVSTKCPSICASRLNSLYLGYTSFNSQLILAQADTPKRILSQQVIGIARNGFVIRRFQGGSRSGKDGGILSRGSPEWGVPSCIFDREDRLPGMPTGVYDPANGDRLGEAVKRVGRVLLQPEGVPDEYQIGL